MATIPQNPTTEQLDSVNEMLAAVGQAPVNQLEATNPDVALAFDTLTRVSREVQAEGWTFNKEYHVKQARSNVTVGSVTQTRIPINSTCLLYTSPSPRDRQKSRMPSSA